MVRVLEALLEDRCAVQRLAEVEQGVVIGQLVARALERRNDVLQDRDCPLVVAAWRSANPWLFRATPSAAARPPARSSLCGGLSCCWVVVPPWPLSFLAAPVSPPVDPPSSPPRPEPARALRSNPQGADRERRPRLAGEAAGSVRPPGTGARGRCGAAAGAGGRLGGRRGFDGFGARVERAGTARLRLRRTGVRDRRPAALPRDGAPARVRVESTLEHPGGGRRAGQPLLEVLVGHRLRRSGVAPGRRRRAARRRPPRARRRPTRAAACGSG